MSKTDKILIIAGSTFMSFCLSLAITMMAWAPFEEKSFDCWDSLPGLFWDSIQTHQQAGDKLLNGYTWERIENIHTFYMASFFAGWLLVAGGLSVVWIRAGRTRVPALI